MDTNTLIVYMCVNSSHSSYTCCRLILRSSNANGSDDGHACGDDAHDDKDETEPITLRSGQYE